ncbi:MAG: alpha-hydroxy-acid oxidizing protein [Clostridiales bacterium]|nr:alpha-hydroxy-acid oxidizing protein [Clostridiales bacterium]
MSPQEYAGDANRITRAYLDSLLIELRHIGATLPDTSFEAFGQRFATPVATAALSHLKGQSGNGMVEMAQGCAQAGALCFAGMGEVEELRQMLATGAQVVKIVKPYADRGMIRERLRAARELGALAVGMDLDHAYDRAGRPDVVLGLPMAALSPQELADTIQDAGLPFILKGVLSVRDTRLAVELGAKGIVVSHHHGIIPFAAPPLMVLPEIVEAAAGRLTIFVDCGINDGYDVFKALALGAQAACVGRVIMGPLQERGPEGLREALTGMTAQLAGVMANTACATLGDLNPGLIRRA